MDRFVDFVRSELFLSLAGGFLLGVMGLTLIRPANAVDGDDSKAVVVETIKDHGSK